MGCRKLQFLAVLTFLLGLSITGKSQSEINIGATQQITNFRFLNSEGNKMEEYSPIYANAYHVGYNHRLESGVFLQGDLGMREAGATMVYDGANYQWDLQYLNTQLGVGYLHDLGAVSPYFNFSVYVGYLVKANQTLNNEDIDIIKSEDLKRGDIGINFGPGVQFYLNKSIAFFSEIGFLRGLQNIESDESSQITNNYAYSLTIGVSYTLE